MRTSALRSPWRSSARHAASSVAAARANSPRQYWTIPRFCDARARSAPREQRLGLIEQAERAIEIAETADDEATGSSCNPAASPASPARRRESTPDRRSAAAASRWPSSRSAIPITQCRRGSVGGSRRSDRIGAGSLPRARTRGSASTWSRNSVTLIAARAFTERATLPRASDRRARKMSSVRRRRRHNVSHARGRPAAACARGRGHGPSRSARRSDRDLRPAQDRRRHRLVGPGRPRPARQPAGGGRQRRATRVAGHVRRSATTRSRRGRFAARDGEDLPFVTVRLRGRRARAINGEERWTLAAVQRAMQRARRARHRRSRPSSTTCFSVSPDGDRQPARRPGGVGRRDGVPRQGRRDQADPNGVMRKVMLSTAEPAEEPRFLRRRLNIEGRRRPQILVLDTGLRTVSRTGRGDRSTRRSSAAIVHDGMA